MARGRGFAGEHLMNTNEITYNNMSAKLIEVLPILQKPYEAELKYWGSDTPGPHNIFGHQFLIPHLYSLIDAGTQADALRDFFKFVELLATNPDREVRAVVSITLMSSVCADARFPRIERLLGDETRKICDEILGHRIKN